MSERAMSRLAVATILVVLAALVAIGVAVFSHSATEKVNSEADVRKALDKLPFSYSLRPADVPHTRAAFVGLLRHPSGVTAQFAVSVCEGPPPRANDCATASIPGAPGSAGTSGSQNLLVKVPNEAPARYSNAERKIWLGMVVELDGTLCHAAAKTEYDCAG